MIIVGLADTPGVNVFTPQNNLASRSMLGGIKNVFLAGTIDNGNSINWQQEVIEKLSAPYVSKITDKKFFRRLNIFNPRRNNWDTEMKPDLDNPTFYRQVSWEHKALKQADYIVMNLLPKSFSPISLLELGLFASSGKLLVICPEGFYRKGNVDFICEEYNIPMFDNIDNLIKYLDTK